MKHAVFYATLISAAIVPTAGYAGQAPNAASAADIPISDKDRVYTADQFSNTVSVVDPSTNTLLGVIRLGEPHPQTLSPLYKGQVLVHGLGFSPDHKTLAVISIGSNSVSFIDTATNAVKHTTYLGRSPHEAFYTPNGKEVWITVRGEDYVSVIDATTYAEKTRINVPAGPGMQIFSPDGKYGYICSSFNPETVVVEVASHKIVGRIKQESPFCPNIAASPDGKQVWFTLKDVGKVQVFNARPPFNPIKVLDIGPITNHVNFVHNSNGKFAYLTVGGRNSVKVFRSDNFSPITEIPVGDLPHGLWPSADGRRMYIGLENGNAMAVIDTLTNKLVTTIPIGQAPQAIVYVPRAVPQGPGTQNLKPLGLAGSSVKVKLTAKGDRRGTPMSHITLFDQGLVQVLQAAMTGLIPKQSYILALAERPDGSGALQTLASFKGNPAGAAIVSTIGPIRQLVSATEGNMDRRYLVVAKDNAGQPSDVIQVQAD